ncbi:hypothetical protein ACIGDM_00950 [Rothia koreensis]|uniref:hypothetical protein n=1 Tax=Rothia koreensis TaxID=592378 RepID=UPI0037C72903
MPQENTTVDIETFNLADWVTGGTEHRLRQTVTIYRDANLAVEVDRIEKAMKNTATGHTAMVTIADTGTDDLETRKQALLDRIQAAKAEVEVFALIDPEIRECREALGDKPTNYDYTSDETYWYQVLARAARLEGQELTPDQWRQVHETVGAQFASIITAYTMASQTDISPRFRR